MFCPNFSNKEVKADFKQLTDKVGEDIAYYLWDKYAGDMDQITLDTEYTGIPTTEQAVSDATVLKSVSDVNSRNKSFTAEQWAESNRLADVLQEIYPELDIQYVDSLRDGQLGQADLDAMRILIDADRQRVDTLPHEYAHYYIAMFRNSDLVKDGVNQFGSEESLVQAIGEQVVKQDGKARSWWKKFSQWIVSLFKGKDAKQALLNELTDAFLRRDPIGVQQQVYGKYNQQENNVKTATTEDIRLALAAVAQSISFNPTDHVYIDKKTGKQLVPTTSLKQKYGYDNYDKSTEDQLQSQITERSAKLGTQIHAVFEAMWFNNFNPNSFPGFTKSAFSEIQKIVDTFKEKYDIVASEALLGDANAGVAGTADIIFRDKSTGELVLGDFKTKMLKYNGRAVNEKGNKLRGFLFALSTKFSPKSTRDAYDFQLSVYEHMINKILSPMGVKISKRVIIPIVYDYNKAYNNSITKVGISTLFGSDDDINAQLKKDHYVLITPRKDTQDLVKHKIFGEGYSKEEESLKVANTELNEFIDKLTQKLRIQSEILSKQLRTQTVGKEAKKLLEKLANLNEIDAIFNYVKFADETLSRLESQIKYRLKNKDNANWSLDVLTDYKNIAESYRLITQIPMILMQFQGTFDEETIKQIMSKCSYVSNRINNIVSAYDIIGKDLYLDMVAPYVTNVKYNMIQKVRNEYIKANPKKDDQAYEQYEQEIKDYTDKWADEHEDEINNRTKKWLEMQMHIADAGFECNSIAAWIGSVYETKDPFVAAMVKIYDEGMNRVNDSLLRYRAQISRILKSFRQKYNFGNLSNFKDAFNDFVEIQGDKCYLVNPYSSEYIEAEKQAKFEIYSDDSKNNEQKTKAYRDWLDKNNPIVNKEEFNAKLLAEISNLLVNEDKEVQEAVLNNLKLPEDRRQSWFQLYKDKKIPSNIKDYIEQIQYNLEIQYRQVNRAKFNNVKYDKLMSLSKDDPKRQLYDLLLSTIQTLDQSLPKSLRLGYRLPGIQKRGMEIRNSDGTIAVIHDAASRTVQAYADDDVRGTLINDDGRAIPTIPLFYRPNKKVTPEEQSFDLPTIFYRWLESASEYVVKTQMEAYVLKTQAVLSNRLTATNKKSLLQNAGLVGEHKVNTENQFAAWVNQVFYGNKLFDLGKLSSRFSDKTYDVGKIVKKLISMASTTAMSGNWIAGLTNVITGEINQAEEAFANQYGIDIKSYSQATKIFVENIIGIIQDFYSVSPSNKLNQLSQYFGVDELDKNVTLSGVLREGIDQYAYIPMRMGDVFMKYRFMTAMLLKMRAKDKDGKDIGSMYDHIKFDENNLLVVDPQVKNFDKKQQDEFSLKLRRLLISIHGNMSSQRSLVAAEMNIFGKAALALRRFIEPNFERRFASKHYDPLLNEERAGFSVTGAKWVFVTNPVSSAVIKFLAVNIFRCKKAAITAQHWAELSELEKKNVIRFGVEIGAMLLMFCTAALVGHLADGGDDDDVSTDWLRLLKYISYRVYTDLSFFYLPSSFVKILKDPFPVISYFNKITSAFTQIFDPLQEYTNGEHLFDNMLLDKTYRLIPGIKQIGRFQNIEQEMEYFIRGN